MPRLSRWAIRLSLLYLLAGFTIGALLLVNKGTGWNPGLWRWFAAHQDFLLLGWMGQFSLGVAYWAFPRYRGNHRGNPALAVASLLLLNLGLGLTFAAGFWGLPWLAWGRTAQALALLAFLVYAWPRVKPIGV